MKTQKLSFNAISGVLSRSEMKKIMAGSGDDGSGCPCYGQDCFWTDSKGCGTTHFIGSSEGNCRYHITYTASQPCGWA